MYEPGFVILYVQDLTTSVTFYKDVFGAEPADLGPDFALFALSNGLMFGLWSIDKVVPATTHKGGGSEICVTLASKNAVDELLVEWRAKGFVIVQEPEDMDFGYTFCVVDPDDHRLRVFAPA